MLYYCLLINLSVHKKLLIGIIVGLFIFLKSIFVIECIFLVDALGVVTCPKERTVWLLHRFFCSKVHLEHISLAGYLLSFWCPFEFIILCSRKLNNTHVPGSRWSTQICPALFQIRLLRPNYISTIPVYKHFKDQFSLLLFCDDFFLYGTGWPGIYKLYWNWLDKPCWPPPVSSVRELFASFFWVLELRTCTTAPG